MRNKMLMGVLCPTMGVKDSIRLLHRHSQA